MRKVFSSFLFVLSLFSFANQVFAGGSLMVNPQNGNGLSWDLPIIIHPEEGSCSSYSNDEIIDLVESNLDIFENIEGVDLELILTSGIVQADIDQDNFDQFLFNPEDLTPIRDGISPLAFDDNGEIVAQVFGELSEFTILGFAGPDFVEGDQIIEGQAVFNCRCVLKECVFQNPITDEEETISSTEIDFIATMMHELGHFIGLDHTGLHGNYFQNCMDNGSDCELIPLMYPVSYPRQDEVTIHRDDEIAILSLYGESGWDDGLCTIEGDIKDINGNTIMCAEIHMIANNPEFSSSAPIGLEVKFDDKNNDGSPGIDGECSENCGRFVLRGLDPDQLYILRLEPINPIFVNGSSVGPCKEKVSTEVESTSIIRIPSCLADDVTRLTLETDFSLSGSTSESESTSEVEDEEISTSSSESVSASASSTCGSNQDFSSCDSLAGCHLNHYDGINFSQLYLFFLSIAISLTTVISTRKKLS